MSTPPAWFIVAMLGLVLVPIGTVIRNRKGMAVAIAGFVLLIGASAVGFWDTLAQRDACHDAGGVAVKYACIDRSAVIEVTE